MIKFINIKNVQRKKSIIYFLVIFCLIFYIVLLNKLGFRKKVSISYPCHACRTFALMILARIFAQTPNKKNYLKPIKINILDKEQLQAYV